MVIISVQVPLCTQPRPPAAPPAHQRCMDDREPRRRQLSPTKDCYACKITGAGGCFAVSLFCLYHCVRTPAGSLPGTRLLLLTFTIGREEEETKPLLLLLSVCCRYWWVRCVEIENVILENRRGLRDHVTRTDNPFSVILKKLMNNNFY